MKIQPIFIQPRKPGAPQLPGGGRNIRKEVRLYDKLNSEVEKAVNAGMAPNYSAFVVRSLESALGLNPEGERADNISLVSYYQETPQPQESGEFGPDSPQHNLISLGGLSHLVAPEYGDFLLEASGIPAIEQGLRKSIPRDSLLLLSPQLETEGKVCLVRITFRIGGKTWAVKRYSVKGLDNNRSIRLRAYTGEIISIGNGNVASVEPVAVVKKVICTATL